MLTAIASELRTRGLACDVRGNAPRFSANLLVTASVDEFLAVAASEWDDYEAGDLSGAEGLAKNHGFLVGTLVKIKNRIVADPKTWFKRISIFSAIMLAGSAIKLAVKDPKKFGYFSKATLRVIGFWLVEMLKFTGDVARVAGGLTAKIAKKTWALLKTLKAPALRTASNAAHGLGNLAAKHAK